MWFCSSCLNGQETINTITAIDNKIAVALLRVMEIFLLVRLPMSCKEKKAVNERVKLRI